MSDSDSDLSEIPMCTAPQPSKKAKIEGIATSNHSLESSVAQREAAARAKAEAEDAERATAAREKQCGNPRHRRDV